MCEVWGHYPSSTPYWYHLGVAITWVRVWMFHSNHQLAGWHYALVQVQAPTCPNQPVVFVWTNLCTTTCTVHTADVCTEQERCEKLQTVCSLTPFHLAGTYFSCTTATGCIQSTAQSCFNWARPARVPGLSAWLESNVNLYQWPQQATINQLLITATSHRPGLWSKPTRLYMSSCLDCTLQQQGYWGRLATFSAVSQEIMFH